MKKSKTKISGMVIPTVSGVAGGLAAAALINSIPIENKQITQAIALIAGVALPIFSKNEIVKGLGAGMAAVAGQKLVANISGMASIAGLPSVANNNAISGTNYYLNKYTAPSVADDSAISGVYETVDIDD